MFLYLARQPVFNRKSDVIAYELLYRSGEGATTAVNPILEPDAATSAVVINSVFNIGLENITGGKPALVNVTRSFLLDERIPEKLSRQLILEVLETAQVDDALVQCVMAYKQKGFKIALDDFECDAQWDPLVRIADIIKLDVLALGESGVQRTMKQVKAFSGEWLAEKVETREEFELYKNMGFDYFQGYFLSKPSLIKEKGIPNSKLTVCRLMSELADPDIDPDKIVKTLVQDARLTFKLLKLINSAAMGLSRQLDSIKQAMIVLGLTEIKRWAMLLAMGSCGGKSHELLMTALVRSRMCQLLAERVGIDGQRAFTVGLLSLFDALMDMSVVQLFSEVSFHDEICAAVLEGKGVLGELLGCVLSYERGDWQRLSCKYEVDLFELYLEALSFVQYGSMLSSD